jgi:anti-sigma factor RsiW
VLSLRRRLECQQAVELITDYLEGSLSRRERRRLEAHLRACRNCSAYLEQIQAVIALSGSVDPEDLNERATSDLIELYRRWRGDGGAEGP